MIKISRLISLILDSIDDSNGQFNKDYDRSVTVKSLYNFLLDPTGDLPWEEEETAQDVIHINEEKMFNKVVKKSKNGVLVMFYAACKLSKLIERLKIYLKNFFKFQRVWSL